MAIIIVPAALLYIALLLWFIRRVYLPRFYLEAARAGEPGPKYRLARTVMSILSVLHAFAFFAVISWTPIFFVLMGVSQIGQPEWGLDVTAYSGFRIDLEALPTLAAEGLRDPVIRGATAIDIDTGDRLAWFLFAISNLAAAIVALFVVLQARNIFVTLSLGQAFDRQNVVRLKRIAYAVVGAYLAAPLVQYFGWGAVIERIGFNGEGLELYPAFDLNLVGILVGIGCYVLSAVIKEAAELRDEQRLTI